MLIRDVTHRQSCEEIYEITNLPLGKKKKGKLTKSEIFHISNDNADNAIYFECIQK